MALALLVPGSIEQLTGGYLFARRIVEEVRAQGHEVTVVELAGRYPDANAAARAAAADGLASLTSGSTAIIDGLALPAFADCIEVQSPRLRLIGWIHHPLSQETGLSAREQERYGAIEAALWPRLRGCLCPSATTARALMASGIASNRIAVVPPGTHKPDAIESSVSSKVIELLSVATITPRKGHLLLVEALADLRDLDWRLTCIGSLERDPQTVAALRHAIARHRLEDRIHLAGERAPELLSDAYRAADVFVLPSYHEGYGMAYAEALAHGLPVIATTAGAVPDTVPATAALFVPPGDARALREALRTLLLDARLRTRLAAGAAQAAASLPDWHASARLWWNEVQRLAA